MKAHEHCAALAALALLVLCNVTPAASAPSIQVDVIHVGKVIVRGTGFPAGKLRVYADIDEPHASVACNKEFQRFASVKGGAFVAVIQPRKSSDCGFLCAGLDAQSYVMTVESLDSTAITERRFACARR